MKLEKWALIAEIIGAVAIVVSLIFVGLEIRNGADQTRLNTQALQMSAYQELIGEVNTLSRFYIQNLDEWYFDQPEELTAKQRNTIGNLNVMTSRFGDLAFYQYQLGMISEARLESVIGVLKGSWCRRSFQDFWNGTDGEGFRARAVPEYRDFVEAGMAKDC